MPKYCPICFSEFKAAITTCPNDRALLVDEKPQEFERLVDVYAASDEIEAERIITFLREEGINGKKSVSGISQLPVVSDTQFIISVVKENISTAKWLIERARNDGVISVNGNFL